MTIVDELLRSSLCWHCGDPLGDEPTAPIPGQPGCLAHDECAIEHDDEGATQ